jgi:hypothetical protein
MWYLQNQVKSEGIQIWIDISYGKLKIEKITDNEVINAIGKDMVCLDNYVVFSEYYSDPIIPYRLYKLAE